MSTMLTIVLRELGRRLLRDEERRAQVGADQLLPVRGLDFAHRDGEEGRGVVHQYVEPAEGLDRRADERARRDGREELGLHLRCAARARRVELGLEPRGIGLGIAVVQQHFRARRVQAARDRRADAPRPARHQSGLAVERVVHERLEF
jgi:hypothetical protein